MSEQIALCSNATCQYYQRYGEVHVGAGEMSHISNIEQEKFCPWCGFEMVAKCESCNKPIPNKDNRFCTECGTAYKKS